MLYRIVRFFVRLSLQAYVKRIGWEGFENVPKGKPILFAPTHSNSFLDAFFLASVLPHNIYCLARGDAFRKPRINQLLRHLRLLPIYRQTEKEAGQVFKNEKTFAECQQIFANGGRVLIFPEGFCTHQTEVLPLKRGMAAMAFRAWKAGVDLHVVPVSISYNSLSLFGKKADVIFSKAITAKDIAEQNPHSDLNGKVYKALSDNFPSPFAFKGKNILSSPFNLIFYYIGWLINFPIYFLAQYLSKRYTKGTVFYDSVVVGFMTVLLFFYYLILIITGIIIF